MPMPLMPTAPVPVSSLPTTTAQPAPTGLLPQLPLPVMSDTRTGSPILSSALTSPSKMMSPPQVPRNFMPQLPAQPTPRLPQPAGGPILASMLQKKIVSTQANKVFLTISYHAFSIRDRQSAPWFMFWSTPDCRPKHDPWCGLSVSH